MNKLVTALAIVLVSGGLFTVHIWRQLDAKRSQVDDLQTRLDKVESGPRSSAHEASSLGSDQAEHATASAPLSSPNMPSSSASMSVAGANTPAQIAERTEAIIGSPENQAKARALYRAQLPVKYPDVAESLGLSKDEAEKLFDLLAKQYDELRRDVRVASTEGETSLQVIGRKSAEGQNELALLLGDKYAQWKQYLSEQPTRQQLRDLAAVLNSSGIPQLTDSQNRSVVYALMEAQKRFEQESMKSVPPAEARTRVRNVYSPERNVKLLEAASSYLTAQQLDAYKEMLERQAGLNFFGGVSSGARR